MASPPGTQLPEKDCQVQAASTSTPSTSSSSHDATEELTEGIKKLSTNDNDAKLKGETLSEDDERSWSSADETVVDEPSVVDNHRQDAIDRIMKSFCATLETKLPVPPKPKVKEEKEEASVKNEVSSSPAPPKLSDYKHLAKSSSPATPPRLSDWKSLSKPSPVGPFHGSPVFSAAGASPLNGSAFAQMDPALFRPHDMTEDQKSANSTSKPSPTPTASQAPSPALRRLSDFKSKPTPLPTSPQAQRLSDFKSKPSPTSPQVQRLSDFKSKPSSPSAPSPSIAGLRLAHFKSLPKPSPPSAPSPSIAGLRLADFKSLPKPSSPSAPSPSITGLRLADFKLLPKPSTSAGHENLPPVLDPFCLQSATLAFPTISPPAHPSLPSPTPSPCPSGPSEKTSEPEKGKQAASDEASPGYSASPPIVSPLASRITEGAFAQVDPALFRPKDATQDKKETSKSIDKNDSLESAPVPEAHSSRGISDVSDEERQRKLLEDVLVRGESLDNLEGVSGLAAAAQAFKAAAESHTGGGAIWDTVSQRLGDLFGLGDPSGAPMTADSSQGPIHTSFFSGPDMLSPPPPPAARGPPPGSGYHFQNQGFRNAPHFTNPLGNATGGFESYDSSMPLGGPVQLERSGFNTVRRTSESSVQTTTTSSSAQSPHTPISRRSLKRPGPEQTIEEFDSEDDEEETGRRILMPKRKSTGSYQRLGTGLTHEVVDEPDGDGRRKKAKKATADTSGALGGGKQKFACPYFKRNPRKYRNWTSCPGPGWEEVHRVKTHLYRRHALPLQCPRCWDVFKTDNVLQGHLQMDPPCIVKSNSVPHEGFTKDQEKRLRSRKKAHADMTDEDKWNEIYQILFPDDDPESIPGPYYDTFDDEDGPTPASGIGSGDLEDYSSFVRREMPTLVRRELESLFKSESPDVEDRLRIKVEQIVLDLQPRLMSLYKQSQIPLSEYGPAQQQSDYGRTASVSTPTSTPGLSSGSAQGVSPCSGVSPGYVTSPAPAGMLTPESTTGYTTDVPYYGGFLTPNMPAMVPNAGMGGHPLYTSADMALLGTGGVDFDPNQFSGVDQLNWDDEFDRILDPGVFMPQAGEVMGGGGYRY